jgi:hypothetical protein
MMAACWTFGAPIEAIIPALIEKGELLDHIAEQVATKLNSAGARRSYGHSSLMSLCNSDEKSTIILAASPAAKISLIGSVSYIRMYR